MEVKMNLMSQWSQITVWRKKPNRYAKVIDLSIVGELVWL